MHILPVCGDERNQAEAPYIAFGGVPSSVGVPICGDFPPAKRNVTWNVYGINVKAAATTGGFP
jgi:hypothetical protein